jgi:hypothetical protein
MPPSLSVIPTFHAPSGAHDRKQTCRRDGEDAKHRNFAISTSMANVSEQTRVSRHGDGSGTDGRVERTDHP